MDINSDLKEETNEKSDFMFYNRKCYTTHESLTSLIKLVKLQPYNCRFKFRLCYLRNSSVKLWKVQEGRKSTCRIF